MIQGFRSPIPKKIESTDELYEHYSPMERMAKKFALIPRFGGYFPYSKLLTDVTKSLSELSNSQVSVTNQITRWTFGGVLDVRRSEVPGLREYAPEYTYGEDGFMTRVDDTRDVVKRGKKIKFAQKLQGYGLTFMGILSVLNELESNQLGQISEGYLLIKVVNVGKTKKVYLTVLDYTRAAVVDMGGKKDLGLMYVSTFDEREWGSDIKPKFYYLSDMISGFNWREKNGVSETVLRITTSTSRYYSKSRTDSILYSMYNEIVLNETTTKLVGSEFISKSFVAFEGMSARQKKSMAGESRSDLEINAKAFRDITSTRQGQNNTNGSALALLEYTHGTKAPVVGKFGVNRDTAWQETVTKLASRAIHGVHSWPMELTGLESYKSGRSGNDILQMYISKDEDVIRPKQDFYESVISLLFNELGQRFGVDLPYTLTPVRHIEEMVNRMAIINRQ